MSDGTLAPDIDQALYALSPEGRKLLFTEAKTAYDFSDKPVGDDRLEAIYELFKWAPTSANINPLRILYVAAGLAAGPMKGFNAAAVDKEFFPDGRWRSILLVNIGYPGAEAYRDRLPRPSYEQAVRLV
ncbi:hypothetical protein ABZ554_27635 [Streptomyces sp. NPDC020125]|uniref:hypothetical protein n=1 Tax=unclassified Streptomyces TaxID=2593676 RepID=UPI0033CB8074